MTKSFCLHSESCWHLQKYHRVVWFSSHLGCVWFHAIFIQQLSSRKVFIKTFIYLFIYYYITALSQILSPLWNYTAFVVLYMIKYRCYNIWLELVNKFSVINWFPSTFGDLLGHHQEVCILQKYNTVFYLYWCTFFFL